jgi:hypothetical protein
VRKPWSKRGGVGGGGIYDHSEHARLVAGFYAALARREAANEEQDSNAGASAAQEMAAIAREYESATPIVSVSRCPFTGDVFETSLDLVGLDGMWWAYDYDYRPFVASLPTFFAWCGSMQLGGPVPNLPLKSMVGPGAPFVYPRLLQHPSIKAVISSVLVGEHTGFPVVYFAQPAPHDLERANDWGHTSHAYTRPDGSPTSAHSIEYDPDKDFDLARWIRQGKLLWIAPGDVDLHIQTTPDDCPFLTVGGERHRQYIQRGKIWMAQDRDFNIR